ncbi:MAG: outer membrane beta-barrel protein [Pseudomonadales bacterium]
MNHVRPLVAAVLLGALTAAPAAALEDWYGSVTLGTAYAEDDGIESAGLRTDFDQGFPAGAIAIGARMSRSTRAEVEVAYRNNDFEVLFSPDGSQQINPDPADSVEAVSVMANLLYDLRRDSAFRPFVGAGVGKARLRYDSKHEITRVPVIDDRADAFAYQLIAGFTFELSRRFDLTTDYRYWRTESFELEDAQGRSGGGRHTVHTTLLGLRYHPVPRSARVHDDAFPARKAGFYVAAAAGGAFAKDANISDSQTNYDAFGPGPAASATVGYRGAGRLRYEIEASMLRNDVELLDFSPDFEEARTDGDFTATSLMANVLFDLARGTIRPYLGVGFGITRAQYDVRTDDGTFVDDKATAPAAQFLVGIDSRVTPRLTVSIGYRLWGARGIEIEQPDGTKLENNQLAHAAQVGLRYALR